MLFTLFLIYNYTKTPYKEAFNPIDNSQLTSVDLTGDGTKDVLKVITKDNDIDIEITSNNRIFNLSDLCNDNILLSNIKTWSPKIFIRNLSRKKVPEIIVQGLKNQSCIQYIFSWNNGSFKMLFSSNKNIFGILDSNNSKTPQCYSINSSSGLSSLESFMLLDNEILNITKDCKSVPDISNILSLIDIIQKDYELDITPDIFKEGIPEKELSTIWHLDKEHNSYSFEDAFFYDGSTDNEGNITSITWRLTFEKYIKEKDDSYKSEVVFYVITEPTSDMRYKIASIYTK